MDNDEKQPQGRPPFQKNRAQSELVGQMKACADSNETIARALRIDVDTLKKHFAEELANGAADARADVVRSMFALMKTKKNPATTKSLFEITRVTAAEQSFSAPAPLQQEATRAEREAPAPKPPKLGKKELQRIASDAVLATTEWGKHMQPAIPSPAKH